MAAPPGSRRRRGRRQPVGRARPRGDVAERRLLRLPPPSAPTAEYVPAVASDGLLFVSGQDPARRGRLAYRGRIGHEVGAAAARAAARLATLNALAAAEAAVGSLARVRRCLVLGCFVDAAPGFVSPSLVREALALLRVAFPAAAPPVTWLRPARGLAGGMPVEVELVLELGPRRSG